MNDVGGLFPEAADNCPLYAKTVLRAWEKTGNNEFKLHLVGQAKWMDKHQILPSEIKGSNHRVDAKATFIFSSITKGPKCQPLK